MPTESGGAHEAALREWIARRSQEHGDIIDRLVWHQGVAAGIGRWEVTCIEPVGEHTRAALATAFAGQPYDMCEVPPPVGCSQWSFFLTQPYRPGDAQVWLSVRFDDPHLRGYGSMSSLRWQPGLFLGHPQPGPALPDAHPIDAAELCRLRSSDPADVARLQSIIERFATEQREELARLRRAAGPRRPATAGYHRGLDAYARSIETVVRSMAGLARPGGAVPGRGLGD
jgi:hypothetical protein